MTPHDEGSAPLEPPEPRAWGSGPVERGARDAVERIFREEYGRVVASLVRRFGDIDVAEEAAAEALVVALERWPADGVPLSVFLREVGLAESSSDARRKIEQGGVRLDGEIVKDPMRTVRPPEKDVLVQVGKRHFVRVRR